MVGRKQLLGTVCVLMALLMLSLSACSGKGEQDTTEESKKTEQKETELAADQLDLKRHLGSVHSSDKKQGNQTFEGGAGSQPAKTFSAETGQYYPYYIRVNRMTNSVTIYELDRQKKEYIAMKPMICSVGREGNTPCGDFQLQESYEWHELFGDVYGQYAVRITGNILFHSVPYSEKRQDSLKTEEFDKLGESASDGCIRLQVGDAKWIFDHCEEGTVVTIFDGVLEEDPFPRPEAPILADTDHPQWDPSDPIEANPWNGGDGRLEDDQRRSVEYYARDEYKEDYAINSYDE